MIDGNKRCIFEETTEEQYEKGDLQFGFCPMLPESERDGVMAAMKGEGFSIKKRWKG